MDYRISPMKREDWAAVREIYGEGIATGNATFETELPEWEKWDKAHSRDCRLVARGKGQVIGWAALSPVSARRVYAGVGEVSVYVSARARGKGVGKTLMKALIEVSERAGIWTMQAGIFPENVGSIALHRSFGFRQVGVRRHLGKMNDRWRDVVLFERRSVVAGV